MSKRAKQTEVKETSFKYEICSNVIEYNGETLYLSKILWEEGLTYEDVETFIIK